MKATASKSVHKSKPANQGSAGKANTQQPKPQGGHPNSGSSKGGSTFFGKQPGGTRGK